MSTWIRPFLNGLSLRIKNERKSEIIFSYLVSRQSSKNQSLYNLNHNQRWICIILKCKLSLPHKKKWISIEHGQHMLDNP